MMFALPHQQDSLGDSVVITEQCVPTFHGSTCLIQGDTWTLLEELGSPMSFTARRPPELDAIPTLAGALSHSLLLKGIDSI